MWVRLQQIGELSRGRSQKRPRNDPALFTNGTFPFIQTGDVARANGHIAHWTTMYNQEGVAQSRIWPAGTVCLIVLVHDPVVVVVPEEPAGEAAPLTDRFQEVCQRIRSIACVQALHDAAGGAVSEDAVHRPVDPFQVFHRLLVLRPAGHLLRPPAHALDPEHGPHPAHQPILPLEVRFAGVQDAIPDIMGGRAAHGEPGEPTEGEHLSPA